MATRFDHPASRPRDPRACRFMCRRAWLHRCLSLFGDHLLQVGADVVRIRGRSPYAPDGDDAALLIAATALCHHTVVVTGSGAAFRRCGCRVENPFGPG